MNSFIYILRASHFNLYMTESHDKSDITVMVKLLKILKIIHSIQGVQSDVVHGTLRGF